MTIVRSLNKGARAGNAVPFWILKTAKAAGWTVPRSGSGFGGLFSTSDVFGDGSEYVGPYDELIGSIGTGIGQEPMCSQVCWFVIRSPNGREYLFVREQTGNNGGDSDWSMRYSKGGLFVGGSAAVIATATDQEDLRPWGGDPWDMRSIFEDGTNRNIVHVAADSDPDENGEYGIMALEIKDRQQAGAIFMVDNLQQCADGDPHTIVTLARNLSGSDDLNYAALYFTGTEPPTTWLNVGLPEEVWGTAYYMIWDEGTRHIYENGGNSVEDGSETYYSVPVIGYNGSTKWYKGVSRWIKSPTLRRRYPHMDDDRGMLYVGDWLINDIWDGLSVPLVVTI